MDDDERYAQCDYCGSLFPINKVELYWVYTDTRDDGRGVFTTGIYCSEPCGEWATSRIGTSRG